MRLGGGIAFALGLMATGCVRVAGLESSLRYACGNLWCPRVLDDPPHRDDGINALIRL